LSPLRIEPPHSGSIFTDGRALPKDPNPTWIGLSADGTAIRSSRDLNFVPDTELLGGVCQENERDRHRLVGRISDDQTFAKKVSRAVLEKCVASYEVEMLGLWTVSVEGDDLLIQMADGQGRATHFFMAIVEGDTGRRESSAVALPPSSHGP
jgi:hypothetical protein